MVTESRSHIVDALKISDGDHQRLVEKLDDTGGRFSGANKRTDVRFPLTGIRAVVMYVDHPGGTRGSFIVRPRNISNGGIGVFHGGFLHSGTRVEIMLGHRRDDVIKLNGIIRHCRLITGRIHEVGVKFESPIRVTDYIEIDGDNDDETTYRLQGNIVCFEETIEESQMLQFQLSELGPMATVATDTADFIQRLGSEQPHLAMIGEHLPEGSGMEFASKVREAGFKTELVLLSASDDPTLEKRAVAAGFRGMIGKPYEAGHLTKVIRERLAGCQDKGRGGSALLLSPFWQNDKARPLILKYLDTLSEWVVSLEEAQRQKDMNTLVRRAREIRTSAGNYGYPPISLAASRLEKIAGGTIQDIDPQTAVYEVAQLVSAACAAVRSFEKT